MEGWYRILERYLSQVQEIVHRAKLQQPHNSTMNIFNSSLLRWQGKTTFLVLFLDHRIVHSLEVQGKSPTRI